MLLVLLVMMLAAVPAIAAGGRFSHLTHPQLAGTRWLIAAGVAQVVGAMFGGTSYALFLLVSAALVPVFLGANRSQPGVALLAAGIAANALVVVLNSAVPVSADALARAGAWSPPRPTSCWIHAGLMLYTAMRHPSTVRPPQN